MAAALRYLSYRPRAEAELRLRLGRRFPAALVDDVIVQLKELRLVDDAAFARLWRESRERYRPRSAGYIKAELLRLGVSREVAEEAVAELDEEASAYRAASKLLRTLKGTSYLEFRRKVEGYLGRRGFGAGVVRRVTAALWEELSDPVGGHHQGHRQDDEPDDVV